MTDCGELNNLIFSTLNQITGDEQALDDLGECHTPLCEARRLKLENDIDQARASLQQLEQQLTPICNLLMGPWRIDANGSDGQLTIAHVDSLTGESLKGTVTFTDQATADDIEGSWDNTAKIITFRRGPFNPVFQDFVGFLGDNHVDQFVILAGSFTESDVPPGTPRSQFGWFARKP